MHAIENHERLIVVHETRNDSLETSRNFNDLQNLYSYDSLFTYELVSSPFVSLDTRSGSIGIRDIDDQNILHCPNSKDNHQFPVGTIFIASDHGDLVHSFPNDNQNGILIVFVLSKYVVFHYYSA